MKKAKRALALALVFALVASFCVTGAAAAPGPGNEDSHVINGEAVTQDGVTVSKTARYVDKNEYEITLEVTIPGNVTVPGSSADVVLVIDRSGSMDDNRKMSAAKEAAKAFADALLKDGNDVRMAVVSYADNVSTNQALTNSAEDVKDAVDDIRANGGTHIQAGIHRAREILSGSKADKRVIVVLSDGEPTYSYNVSTAAAGSVEHHSFYDWTLHNNFGDFYDIQFSYDNIVGDGTDYDYGFSLGYAGVYAYCEECNGQVSENVRIYENHGGPTIAEADFASEDGCEVYGLYLGEPDDNAKYTMEGVADSGKYEQASGDSLNGLLQDIAGDVTETTAGAVTDPMGENIVLGDVSELADDGVSVSADGRTLNWNPTQSQGQQVNGGIKYTVTYPITVNGNALDESDWVDANGRTTFSYRVNGEHKTVDFNVPLVWGEKVETETPHDVYVYVKVVGENGADGNLSDEELAEVRGWGLTTLNKDGYFTIGKVSGCMLPATDAYAAGTNIYDDYSSAVNIGDIVRHAANEAFALDDVEWYTLHTASGATDYSGVSSDTLCWHLDGRITIEDLEKRLVTVTYYKNADDATGTMEDQSVIMGFGVTLRENGFTNPGYTFTGWNTQADGQGTDYDAGATIDALNEDLTLYAQWSRNADEVYIKVYLDGADNDVTAQYATYLSGLTTTGTTAGSGSIEYDSATGSVVVPYTYDDINAADVQFSVSSGYVLQGVSGTFVFGSSGWGGSTGQGVAISGSTWTVDNVDGQTTLSIYLNTKYSVEYEVPFGTAPTDGNTYITVEGVGTANTPVFPADIDPNQGVEGSWKNTDATIKTQITLATLPTGTTGWYNESNVQYTQSTLEVSTAAAENSGYDTNNDHTFTFTATAVNYTVTYTDGVEGEEVFADQTYDGLTYGEDTPDFLVDGSPADPEREGYTFTGWSPNVAEKVTGDATYTATWTADEDTVYKVEYCFENLEDDGFTIDDSQTVNGSGTTGDKVEAEQKEFAGFTFDAGNEDNVTSGTIAGDGSLVLKLYYVRNTYTVTYNANGGEGTMTDGNSPYKYGAAVTVLENGFTYEGHRFTGWKDENGTTYQPNATFEIEADTTLYAQWEEITGTLTVTKTFSGLDALPAGFQITVTGEDYEQTFGLEDTTPGEGSYTWTIPELSLGTYTVSESGYKVEGYLCKGDGPKTVTISAAEGASVTLTNSYTAISRELAVEKSVVSVGGVDVTDTVPEAKVGDTIIYKIVVTNNSNVALENISVTDELAGQLYTDEDCETEATLPIASLDAGESATFYAKYTVKESDAGKTLTNTAVAKADDDTTGEGEEEVEVKEQYTLTVNHRYDTQDGEVFETGTETLNEGDEWSATAKADVKHDGVNYIFDASLSTSPLNGTISGDVTVNLVYVKDELDDEDDTETGGDDIPDYKQAVIKYVAEDGGEVSPTIEVVTLNPVDDTYKDTVTADSTATPAAGNVFGLSTGRMRITKCPAAPGLTTPSLPRAGGSTSSRRTSGLARPVRASISSLSPTRGTARPSARYPRASRRWSATC